MKIQEVILVEGKYDVDTVKQVFDATVLSLDGFQIFKNPEKRELIRQLAEKRGIIILTDSDRAGFQIRHYLKGIVPADQVKQVYIPRILGKEKRKKTFGKEGILGVEGMSPETLRDAFEKAGITIAKSGDSKEAITKADLMTLGLTGRSDSVSKRRNLLKRMGFPETMSCKAMLESLNVLYTREKFLEMASQWEKSE